MWVTTFTTQSLLLPPIFFKLPPPPPPPTITTATALSSLQLRRQNPHPSVNAAVSSSEDTGGLGQAMFSALKSSLTNGPNPSKKGQPNTGNELSGSDILRALQKASARKANTKKQNNKKRPNEFQRNTNDNVAKGKGVGFDKVRPITIKNDWVTRLADLEKRLQEFHVL